MITANDLSGDIALGFVNANKPAYATMMRDAASFADSLGHLLQTSGQAGNDAAATGAPGSFVYATNPIPDAITTAPASLAQVNPAYAAQLADSATNMPEGGLTVNFTEQTDEMLYGTAAANQSSASFESDTKFGAASADGDGAPQIDAEGSQQISLTETTGEDGPGGGYGIDYDLEETESVTLHFDNAAQMAAELPQFIGSMQQRLGDAEEQLGTDEAKLPVAGSISMGYGQSVTLNVTAGSSDPADGPTAIAQAVGYIPADAPPDAADSVSVCVTNGSAFSSSSSSFCLLNQPENSSSSNDAADNSSSAATASATTPFETAAAEDAELMHADLRLQDSQTLQAEIQALFGGGTAV